MIEIVKNLEPGSGTLMIGWEILKISNSAQLVMVT